MLCSALIFVDCLFN